MQYLAGMGGAAGLVAAASVVAALLSPAPPVSLVTVGADYAVNLAVEHNAAGWRGVNALHAFATRRDRTRLLHAAAEPIEPTDRFNWRECFAKQSGDTAVVYVSLHGGADADGPFLLTPGWSPDDPQSDLLRVAELLDALTKEPSDRTRIVVFDATTSPGDWRHGAAENRFASGLRELNDRIAAIPGLVVVSASDAGQRSWPAASGGWTAFSDALLRGLEGVAPDKDHDGRIDGDELIAYVRHDLAQRVRAERDRPQEPLVLPIGAAGRRRLAAIDLAFVRSTTPAPRQAGATPRDQIARVWDDLHALRPQLGAPESEQPVAWRRRQRLALRHEQLLLAGAESAADRVAEAIQGSTAALLRSAGEGPRTPGDAEPNAPASVAADEAFAKLLAASPSQLPVSVEAMLESVAEPLREGLRSQLTRRAVDLVVDEPVASLRRAAKVIRALAATGGPPATDAHLVLVLADGLPEDLSAPGWDASLRLAINTRRASEAPLVADEPLKRAHASAILPMLSQRLCLADESRLLGEDLLFVGAGVLDQATTHLTSASQQYKAINADSQALRRALRLRDTAFGALPFYAESIAGMRATSEADAAEIEQLTSMIEAAYAAAHGLADRLLDAAAPAGDPSQAIAQASGAADECKQKLADADSGFKAWLTKLARQTGPTLVTNREAALRVPTLATGDRLRLIELAPEASGASQLGKATRRVDNPAWRQEETRRVVRMALASIGARAFNREAQHAGAFAKAGEAAGADSGPIVATCARVWRESLAAAERIASLARQDDGDRAERRAIRDRADGVRRLSMGYQASEDSLLLELGRSRLRRLCLWRADRALAAGWSDTLAGSEPHARRLALAALRDAEQATPGHPSIERARGAALAERSLAVSTPGVVEIVSDSTPPVAVGASVAGGGLATPIGGVGAVSVDVPAGFVQETPSAGARLPCPIGGTGGFATPTLLLRPADTGAASGANLSLTTWFRGERAASRVRLRIAGEPSVAIDQPPRPSGAGVAIVGPVAAAPAEGAIALVLDASGSMGPGDKANSRFHEAVKTLQTILADVPAGVRVSVWVFGEAVGPGKTTDHAESTIRRVLDPTPWDPTDALAIDRLIDRLSYPAVEPWNESPLTRALLLASRDLRDEAGYKAVIAITDGVDNRFAKDPSANPGGRSIEAVVNDELDGAGIAVHVVGYRVAAGESDAAQRQFAFVERRSPAGRWWEADEAATLDRALRSALAGSGSAPLRRSEEQGKAVGAAVAASTGDQPVWPDKPVAAGLYDLPKTTADASVQRALLEDGDLLLLAVRPDASASRLARVPYSAAYHSDRPAVETADWRVALLADRRLPDGGRSAIVSIERAPDASDPLTLKRPAWVWIESASGSAPIGWRRLDGFPAPCWEVNWPDFPADAPSDFAVWWGWSESEKASAAIRKQQPDDEWTARVGDRWDLGEGSVALRRLALETRSLPTPSGRAIEQPCLVVELKSDTRCVTRLTGFAPAGQRHRWFDEAGVGASTYWPVTQRDLDRVLQGIDILSIPELKRQAEAASEVARFERLPAPRPDDHRPTPAVGWFDSVAPTPGVDQVGAVRRGE